MRERKYVKFRVDMYEDTKFKIIDRMSNRDLIHYVWNRVVVLAGKVNQEGELYMSRNIPYTVETLSIEFNRDISEVKSALDVLMNLEMIEIVDNNIYKVKNFVKHQNIKVKEKTEIVKKDSEIDHSKSSKIEAIEEDLKNINGIEIESNSEIAESLRNSKIDIETPESLNKGIRFKEEKVGVYNGVNNENNIRKNQDKDEKNNISQHNNSPVILEMKKSQNTDKKNKRARKKKIRDDIVETNENDEFSNVAEEEKEIFCWLTEEEMIPKEGEKVILEMSF
ncbi:phage replisome organizer N-terminal domain-containing protein [Clostridium beijerinckii]|uniref:phage replisome organizer N-terminal domain-containing protein n=1 Tax=Clostridium beijerinckii TaxID=1520 RepID=UPI001360BE6D|nr:phage replisome organizer N-terminal domain-containing protein [Clostridium beijerinckii]MZK49902.1 replication protein [Clostridium beijerinckii]MZK57861.1 replication protein [Clostridium beijerinckii]MZK68072.1 replication protein [Clostridium beijerinckii]MZK73570.1 replication protein [Clostridium beijerinckii]MZK83152.1 replication protein [Clostridium beijerinckii]